MGQHLNHNLERQRRSRLVAVDPFPREKNLCVVPPCKTAGNERATEMNIEGFSLFFPSVITGPT